jgi:hypothetical protein
MTEAATDFEIFRRQRTRQRNDEATVTVSRFGLIYFSGPAYCLLGEPEAVVLLHNRKERVIAFRPAAEGDDSAYLCRGESQRSRTGRVTRTVSATAFCKHIGLALSESRRWPLVMRDGLGTVDLNQPGATVSRNGNTA